MILLGTTRTTFRLQNRARANFQYNIFSFVTKRTNVSSRFQQKARMNERSFMERLNEAWEKTKVTWYPIPIGIGIAFLAFQHTLRVYSREKRKEQDTSTEIRPIIVGPWQVHVIDALPLRALSRLWGRINNEYNLPVWLRKPFYKTYSWFFKCNLEEIENTDLKSYPNLGSFFYRSLKPGVRPIENATLVGSGYDFSSVSPADGKVLSFGLVNSGNVEQVKGITYSLDAFLGQKEGKHDVIESVKQIADVVTSTHIADEKEFANVNGITYTLDALLGDDPVDATKQVSSVGEDASVQPEENNYKKELAIAKSVANLHEVREGNALYFCVIYLSPGDYHRFHSPTNWVVEKRRHFAGELFSVSPYMLKMLPDLLVLNERVALLGRWRYGFFSVIPVGATNVGSIRINFDKALRTNRREDLPVGTYTEVSYKKASKLLGGQPLRTGDEMGGFCLGSTIVLVFEAPFDFKFYMKPGQKIKYGQKIGEI